MSFCAKTREGYIIKVLSELLADNIKIGCFEISSQGFFFKMSDTHKRICIAFELTADRFDNFTFSSSSLDKKTMIGINLPFLQKILKSVKKNEPIEIIRESETSDVLIIKQTQIKESRDRIITNCIKIQEIQAIDMCLCDGYDNYVAIPACDYPKMCKDMGAISHDVLIQTTASSIKFTSDVSGVYARTISFGDEITDEPIIFSQHFESNQLNNLKRISGLSLTKSCNLYFHTKENLPLMIRTNVGTIGKLCVYIKSKEQIEMELDE